MSRKINNRNLIVTETFDEFTFATEDMDFSVEDLVAYVTSLAQVFYWLNVESVWGRIGFVWDGYNQSTRQGYGHFVHTTIPFSVVPSLPDGERITEIRNNFISETSVTKILKSNWENLNFVEINANTTLDADFRGAPLAQTSRILYNSFGTTMYLRADFSNCNKIQGFVGTWVVDDENKGLNIATQDIETPTSSYGTYIGGSILWKGEGPFKEEYVWRDIDENSVIGNGKTPTGIIAVQTTYPKVDVTSEESHSYDINVYPSKDMYRYYRGYRIKDTEVPVYINVHVVEGESYESLPVDLAVYDNTFKGAVINYDDVSRIYDIRSYLYKPYIADSWPVYNASLWSKFTGNSTDSYIFYKPYFVNEPTSCPYTLDMIDRSWIRVSYDGAGNKLDFYNYTGRVINDWEATHAEIMSKYEDFNITYEGLFGTNNNVHVYEIDTFPTFTNVPSAIDIVLCDMVSAYPSSVYANGAALFVCKFDYPIESIYSLQIPYYIRENETLTVQNINAPICIEDTSVTCIHLKYLKEGTQIYWSSLTAASTRVYAKQTTDLNFFDVENISSLAADNKLNMNTYMVPGEGYTYLQPFIITAANFNFSFTSTYNRYFNPSFICVSNTRNLSIVAPESEYLDSNNTFWTLANIKLVFSHIYNYSATGGTITLKEWIFDLFTTEEIDHLINDLNFTVIKQL